ncbi:MAG: hypothetical protein KDD44_11890, partial [Bdellovibrionales bacterium]|nr:hypothetical protein [Bdellovibrionales bacterium]
EPVRRPVATREVVQRIAGPRVVTRPCLSRREQHVATSLAEELLAASARVAGVSLTLTAVQAVQHLPPFAGTAIAATFRGPRVAAELLVPAATAQAFTSNVLSRMTLRAMLPLGEDETTGFAYLLARVLRNQRLDAIGGVYLSGVRTVSAEEDFPASADSASRLIRQRHFVVDAVVDGVSSRLGFGMTDVTARAAEVRSHQQCTLLNYPVPKDLLPQVISQRLFVGRVSFELPFGPAFTLAALAPGQRVNLREASAGVSVHARFASSESDGASFLERELEVDFSQSSSLFLHCRSVAAGGSNHGGV